MKDQTRINQLNELISAAPGETTTDKYKWVASTLHVSRRTIYIWRSRKTGASVGLRSLDLLRDAVKKACNPV